MKLAVLLLSTCLALAGCGGDTPVSTQSVKTPANVLVLSGSVRVNGQQDIVTLDLSNTGGPGAYKIEFWALPSSIGGGNRLLSTSDVVSVAAGYRESVKWTLSFASFGTLPRTDFVLVYSRDPNTAVFRQTAKFTF
jgi:hypothetical protein